MLQVSLEEAKSQLRELIASAVSGEDVFLTMEGQQVVRFGAGGVGTGATAVW